MIDFAAINAGILGNYLNVLQQWLPNGKKIGPDWCVGSLAGEEGQSLKIHVRKGVWKDFASGQGGSDPVSLYAAIHAIPQGEAAKRLGGAHQPAPARAQKPAPPPEGELEPVLDPPDDMPDPKLPACTARYTYRNAEGNVLGFISRIDSEDGKKKTHPAHTVVRRAGANRVANEGLFLPASSLRAGPARRTPAGGGAARGG